MLFCIYKKNAVLAFVFYMAESMRFELTVAFTTPPFQDGALNRSANSPRLLLHFTDIFSFVNNNVEKCR